MASKNPDRWVNGRTRVSRAAWRGDELTIERLVKVEGADPNAPDKYGGKPVFSAGHGGHHKCIRKLRECGADINMKDAYGRSLVHIAAMRGDARMICELMSYPEADMNARDRKWRTALHAVAEYSERIAANKGGERNWDCAVASELLWGVNVNALDENLNTALHIAMKKENVDFIVYLVMDGKARVDIPNMQGYTVHDIAKRLPWSGKYRKIKWAVNRRMREHGQERMSAMQAMADKKRDAPGVRDLRRPFTIKPVRATALLRV